MQVFKFGGASIKNAEGIKNIAQIIYLKAQIPTIVVISAAGKTTNALERVVDAYFLGEKYFFEEIQIIENYHVGIAKNLFQDDNHVVFSEIKNLIVEIKDFYTPFTVYNFIYDQLVSFGELLSTKIVYYYLIEQNIPIIWIDSRTLIKTTDNFREPEILWAETRDNIKNIVIPLLSSHIILTQGFIGSTLLNFSTTLGREGSDFTAAIFGNILDADSVTVWKDVPGIFTADPKIFSYATKIDCLSYYEAIEMTYYGAQVIHPKTIKPLYVKQIPLYVKSFENLSDDGTFIGNDVALIEYPPIIIVKKKQVLVSITTKDFSFITEHNLSEIYAIFAKLNIKINLIQNSALSFSAGINNEPEKINALFQNIQPYYKILKNDNLQLLTIRHYTSSLVNDLTAKKEIFLSQQSRHTAQFLISDREL